jgi:hypothetical protein
MDNYGFFYYKYNVLRLTTLRPLTYLAKLKERSLMQWVGDKQEIANVIYHKWLALYQTKSFVAFCERTNNNFCGDRWDIEKAVKHLAEHYELFIDGEKIDLFTFMCENLESLKNAC